MPSTQSSMAQQVAQAASTFLLQVTGRAPKSVTAILNGDTLTITLREALTPAEKALATVPGGAAKLQEFHRQLFATSSESLRQEIQRITGVKVCEAAAEVNTVNGAVVHAFTNGTMVQVFLLAGNLTAQAWTATES